jgi:hypothetical protein
MTMLFYFRTWWHPPVKPEADPLPRPRSEKKRRKKRGIPTVQIDPNHDILRARLAEMKKEVTMRQDEEILLLELMMQGMA